MDNGGEGKGQEKGKDKKRVKGSTRGRQEEDVARNKQFKSERVFFYGDFKITVVNEYCMG